MFRDLGIYERFGWCDEVGPLWFLQLRWTVGPAWRKSWARFYAGKGGIAMQAHSKKGGYPVDGFFIPALVWRDMGYAQKEEVVMSWVSKLRRPSGEAGRPADAVDQQWVHDLPALHEFLTLGTHADGSPRRTSTLTLFADGGSWKCFLNERDGGASLCATGGSIADALSALEVMLEGENPPWRFSDAAGPSNGKKRR